MSSTPASRTPRAAKTFAAPCRIMARTTGSPSRTPGALRRFSAIGICDIYHGLPRLFLRCLKLGDNMIYVAYTCFIGALKMATRNEKSNQSAAADAATTSSRFTSVFAIACALAALMSCSSESTSDGEQQAVDADSGSVGPNNPIDSGALDLGDPIPVEPT